MDSMGSLELAWAKGYDGSRAEFITRDVICFKCGNKVKFVAEDGHESAFPSPSEGMGPLAVHGLNHVFAFADVGVDPTVYVYQYPSYRTVSELKGGAKLEYSQLTFSSSEYLASITGIPEFQLILWNFNTGQKLCSSELTHATPTCVTFNPANWREMCIGTDTELFVWRTERSEEQYNMEQTKVALPTVEGYTEEEEERDIPTRASTRLSRITINIPRTAVAGVKGDEATKFAEYQDNVERVRPVSHVWTPVGDVLVGCVSGQLLKVDGETNKVCILYNPGPRAASTMSRLGSSKSVTIHEGLEDASTTSLGGVASMLSAGSLNSLALHKQGLFAAGEDGTVRRLEITPDQVQVADSVSLGVNITSLSFNPSHHHLAVGSDKGTVHICKADDTSSVKLLFDMHYGKVISVDVLAPSNELCVSVREDGELQVWQMESSRLLGSFSLGVQACSMAASPLSPMALVGTQTGFVFFMDVSAPESPRILQRAHVHRGPVRHIVFSQEGHFVLTGSDDGHVFVLDGRPSKKFVPFGHILVDGEVMAISTLLDDKTGASRVLVTFSSTQSQQQKQLGATRLMSLQLPRDLPQDLSQKYASLKCDFKDEVIDKLVFNLSTPAEGVALGEDNVAFTLSHATKHLHKLTVPTKAPKKDFSKDSYLRPEVEVPVHALTGGRVLLSPHHKWLASSSADGKLSIRSIGALEQSVEVWAHDFRSGGCHSFAFSADAQRMVTAGADGTVSCYKWNFSSAGQGKAKLAIEAARARRTAMMQESQTEKEAVAALPDWSQSDFGCDEPTGAEKADKERLEKEQAIESAIERDDIYSTPTPLPADDSTWLETKELEALREEDKQYASVKKDLRESIREMRRKLQLMMVHNEEVPDIEKLGHNDFDLDVEEQSRLQAEGEAEVQRIREEMEFENLAKEYLTELIKIECWDEMKVKGRGITAFNSPQDVHNYPMKERTRQEKQLLERAQEQRQVEKAELKARKEIAEISSKSTSNIAEEDGGDGEDGEEGKEKPSTTGSLENTEHKGAATRKPGSLYGGESNLFYSQFELHTREQKMTQIVLLEDAIFRIKQFFNKEFDEVYHKKEQEISKIKDKNKRILKILDDLDLPLDIEEPALGVVEKPEMLLTVSDEEEEDYLPQSIAPLDKPVIEFTRKERAKTPKDRLKTPKDRPKTPKERTITPKPTEREKNVQVEKFLTPEQRKRAEEEAKQDEERRLREKGDNWRDRGLDRMMGGVLEIKKEDELKRDVPLPGFMQNKAEDEWTEDEKKAVKEYEAKVKELNEEREKYRKQLEMELKKLQSLIQDGTLAFDEILNQLFLRKIKTEMVVFQEELKIVRLKNALLIEEELDNQEAELGDLLEHKKKLKQLSGLAVSELRKNMDSFKELYEILTAEDKVMDKAFKREFNDVSAIQVDQLYRLFKRRPRGQKARGGDTPLHDPTSGNPFSERPSSARQQEHANQTMEVALTEFDKPANVPEGVDLNVWERMCQLRRQKIESENMVKNKALVLAEMQAFLARCSQEDEQLRNDIDDITDKLSALKEERMRITCNLEVQLVLKQGQVEVDAKGFIHDYRDSLLIHRGVTEELNSKIRSLGKSKITSMEESKDFRKGIIQLEWEHKKMTMEMEDLQNKMRDIQNLKVTREIQGFLNEEDHEAKKSQEIATLEQTIVVLRQHHERHVQEKKKMMKELKKTIQEKDEENGLLSRQLNDLNVSVNERRHIHEVNADKRSDAGREMRYREIVQRRKLVDLAKAQAQEVAVLRAEVERLRMRTFPALVQVEH